MDTKRIIRVFVFSLLLFSLLPTFAFAAINEFQIPGYIYEFKDNSNYDFTKLISSELNSPFIGELIVSGDLSPEFTRDTFDVPKYLADNNVSFSYRINSDFFKRESTEWHISNDSGTKVNSVSLNDKIKSGALIVQTSLDQENWATSVTLTDIFANGNTEIKDFFETKDLQLQNGCYYKIYIAYRLEKQVDKKIIINYKGKEYKEVCEEYLVYINKDTDSLKPNDTPRKEIGKTTYSTEKDKGFAGYSDIKRDDPHFGWSLGTFSINGFTSDTEYNGKTYYLKNVGDRVTLWFHLNQDINALNRDAKLTISEDKNGYDQYFQIPETNFKHGALIIRYTDKENKSSDPIIYTDFLAAAATPFADTKVQLFEEGDYEVSLDYEIKDQRGEFNAIPKYTNYKMSFSFSIRNGNCMVYPFDIKTKSELSDYDVTPNGFKLDMAKSRYLEVNVIREALKKETDGTLKTDVRFNRPAKDGDVYDEEGIYTFKVNNKYTGEVTEKTLFVGSDNYIMALAKAQNDLKLVNESILAGAIIKDDGSIVMPTPSPSPTPAPTPTPEPTPESTQFVPSQNESETQIETTEKP